MKRNGWLVLAASLASGCQTEGTTDMVGAIITAPITAPIMFISARMNDRETFLERARQNNRPLPPIDARSKGYAQATLEQALEQGAIDEGLYWRNDEDASGRAGGGVTLLGSAHTDDGRTCRDVLIETVTEGRPTDQRVRTYCRSEGDWTPVARDTGEDAPLR